MRTSSTTCFVIHGVKASKKPAEPPAAAFTTPRRRVLRSAFCNGGVSFPTPTCCKSRKERSLAMAVPSSLCKNFTAASRVVKKSSACVGPTWASLRSRRRRVQATCCRSSRRERAWERTTDGRLPAATCACRQVATIKQHNRAVLMRSASEGTDSDARPFCNSTNRWENAELFRRSPGSGIPDTSTLSVGTSLASASNFPKWLAKAS
mmetsp:Transcript_983/g.1614  ORF Transcript_983/g.1614 Transcript_983/m.1614 type:complete len:207 (-) Transcript_983:2358-2978(-)